MALAYDGGTLGLHPRRHGSIPCGATIIKRKEKKMIHFICAHCEREIRDLAIIIDKTHFVHVKCEKEYREKIALLNDNVVDECEAADCLD